jgi:hypothetical protein
MVLPGNTNVKKKEIVITRETKQSLLFVEMAAHYFRLVTKPLRIDDQG